MAKQLLKERFQQLAGIKPLYERKKGLSPESNEWLKDQINMYFDGGDELGTPGEQGKFEITRIEQGDPEKYQDAQSAQKFLDELKMLGKVVVRFDDYIGDITVISDREGDAIVSWTNPLDEAANPKDLKNKLASAKDQIANHPLLQKAIDKVANSPRLFKLLQKVANKFGIVNLNENLEGDIDLDAIIKTAMKHKDKINEGDADGGLVFGAMFGLPMLATLLPKPLFDALYQMLPGYGGTKAGILAMASLLLGLLVVGVARRMKGGALTQPDKEGGM